MNIHFGREQIARNIRTHGQIFVFTRSGKNSFGEPDGTQTEVASVQGLFHQTRGFITKNISDGTISRNKPQPQILCLADDSVKPIQHGDQLEYAGNLYVVTGVDDINNLGIACDISLEVFDNGV